MLKCVEMCSLRLNVCALRIRRSLHIPRSGKFFTLQLKGALLYFERVALYVIKDNRLAVVFL